MFIRHAIFLVLPLLLVSSAAAQEPVRRWIPLQGPVIEGQLIRVAGDKIYVRDAQGEVQSIKIELLAGDSRSYLGQIREPLPFWQTPEETELIAQVKQRLDRTAIVRVESAELKLDNLGLVIGTDGAYNLILCTSNSEKRMARA